MIFNESGGASLNYKVVKNPQPSNPSPNTIWINTDRKITGTYFQPTKPATMAEGEVWISTGTSSNTAFNALKKGSIMVYPLNAKQMVNGALVDVGAKSFQNGKWVDWWNGELYENGVEFEGYTGGWKLVVGSGLTKYPTYMQLINEDRYVGCVISQTTKIDLSKYNTLSIEYAEKYGDAFGVSVLENVSASMTFEDFYDKALAKVAVTGASGVVTLNVRSINVPCYIAIGGCDEWTEFAVAIKKVWLT